jgi:hypothetical protein
VAESGDTATAPQRIRAARIRDLYIPLLAPWEFIVCLENRIIA